MWNRVHGAVADLEWDRGLAASDLMGEWASTVATLVAVRRTLAAQMDSTDPIALTAVAARGALRVGVGADPIAATSMAVIRAALQQVRPADAAAASGEHPDDAAVLNFVAYTVTHWTRVRAGDHPARDWLLAVETALDAAVHHPAGRTATAIALADWQRALVDTQHSPDPIHRRGAVRGHLMILSGAHQAVEEATHRGHLPASYGDALVASIRALGAAYQSGPVATPRSAAPTAASEHLMLRLGTVARALTGRHGPGEGLADRIDGLLRSTMANAGVVAALDDTPRSRRAADQLQHLCLQYLAEPALLNRAPTPTSTPPAARAVETRPTAPPVRPSPIESTIRPGTVLDAVTVTELCRVRDLGKLAAAADPANPPAALVGIDPRGWPQHVAAGRQAVADLAASAIPMAYARARGSFNLDDTRGELLLALMRAAHAYQPTRGAPWSAYAWRVLDNQRLRGVDATGSPNTRQPLPIHLGAVDLPSRTPGPEDTVLGGRLGVDAIHDLIDALPLDLRRPLEGRLSGQSWDAVATSLGMSTTTARRRVDMARELLQHQLGSDGPHTPTPAVKPRWMTSGPLPAEQPGETPAGQPGRHHQISR